MRVLHFGKVVIQVTQSFGLLRDIACFPFGQWIVTRRFDHVYTIRGSIQPSTRSAIRFATSSIADITINRVPATYISWLRNALRKVGPVVGIDMTTPIRIEDEIILGTSIAITLITGLIAARTA